jgi:hypothetical protein
MALLPDTRQFPVVAYLEFTYADVAGSAAINAVAIQPGSIVTDIELWVTTSFSGGTTHDLDIGDATDPDEYTPTISELDGAAGLPANAPTTTGFQTTLSEPNITFTPVHTGGDPTAGAARFWVQSICEGRFHENYE